LVAASTTSGGNALAYTNPVIWAEGAHGDYQWLTTGQHDLGTLLRLCPEALLGKYVAVTSIDSGPLILNEDEVSTAWQSRSDVAYSPRIQSVEKLAYGECAGFDEWYVFDAPTELGQIVEGNIFESPLQPGQVAVFVNYGGFGFHSSSMQVLTDMFWKQLEWIHPESYIADGDLLNFVSRDRTLFTTVLQSLSGKSS
jgi:hypothetical protein